MSDSVTKVAPGVVTGNDVQEVFRIAKANKFAFPAVNVVGTDSINAILQAAKEVNSPGYYTVFEWRCAFLCW